MLCTLRALHTFLDRFIGIEGNLMEKKYPFVQRPHVSIGRRNFSRTLPLPRTHQTHKYACIVAQRS